MKIISFSLKLLAAMLLYPVVVLLSLVSALLFVLYMVTWLLPQMPEGLRWPGRLLEIVGDATLGSVFKLSSFISKVLSN